MRFVTNSRDEYYHIIEELVCPFNEKKDFIILHNGDIIYWQNANNYYIDKKLNIKMMKDYINEIEVSKWRNESRRQKTLNFSREILSKMIAYKREIKIESVLNKISPEDEYKYWVC